jgi:hypothetical protein
MYLGRTSYRNVAKGARVPNLVAGILVLRRKQVRHDFAAKG